MTTTTTDIPTLEELRDVFDKRRPYFHIKNGRTEDGLFKFDVNESLVASEDSFEEDLLLISFRIAYMETIGPILHHFGLNTSKENFLEQCREVIAVAENHQNEQGGGKMSFQSLFYNIPESILAVNYDAIIVLAIHVYGKQEEAKDYRIVGYIHANEFDFAPYEDESKIERGYYYNMLRVTEHVENGVKIYRRKKIFSLMFSILHHLVYQNGVNFCFACMGKENQSIKEALHRNTHLHGEYYERLPFTMYSKINRFYGSKKEYQNLVDITHDEPQMRAYYKKMHAKMKKYLFYNHLSFESFQKLMLSMKAYSPSSGVYAHLDASGNIISASTAMNWGEFLEFQIVNPKGVFILAQKSGIMKHFFKPMMGIGKPEDYKKLLKGLCYKYHKESGVGVTVISTSEGDEYYDINKSLLDDQYAYFIICNDEQKLQQFKKRSEVNGHPMLFLDQPII
ncbi:MAG: hypothetical protein H6603_02710 [Flavobacteriales bacterium]|nr:hypothetical protein [Flavobacteriales bacterium]